MQELALGTDAKNRNERLGIMRRKEGEPAQGLVTLSLRSLSEF